MSLASAPLNPLYFARVRLFPPSPHLPPRPSSPSPASSSHLHTANDHLPLPCLPHVVRLTASPSPSSISSTQVLTTIFLVFSHLSSSGALTTFSLLNFLRHPSLRSTGLLVAGTSGAALYYAGGKAAMTGLEDGPWVGVGTSCRFLLPPPPHACSKLTMDLVHVS